jgi:H+/Cl- antiporter ClcA
MPAGQRITLVAAGAGAGIAATFNTPIGGVMFAIELMMSEVSVRTFLPVAISTGAATFIERFFLGQQPAFAVPPLPPPLRTTLRGYFQSRDGRGVALTPAGRDARCRLVAARHDDIAEVLAI